MGAHGLPLIGSGDWNDGMNRVGAQGTRRKCVAGLVPARHDRSQFAPYAEARDDDARVSVLADNAPGQSARHWRQRRWDGQWYRRGYYDDGTPLGSDESAECKIDAIAQSWSVMSGVADPAHAAQAMAAVDERLIRRDGNIALLLTPPFDRTPPLDLIDRKAQIPLVNDGTTHRAHIVLG